jgi:hypothetical protein
MGHATKRSAPSVRANENLPALAKLASTGLLGGHALVDEGAHEVDHAQDSVEIGVTRRADWSTSTVCS